MNQHYLVKSVESISFNPPVDIVQQDRGVDSPTPGMKGLRMG